MVMTSAEAAQASGRLTSEEDADLWRVFSAPPSDEVFFRAWLSLLCRQLPEVDAGAVLLQSAEANTFVPVAVWPEATRDLSFLGAVAQRALIEARGVVQRADDGRLHVGYPIQLAQQMLGAVVLEAGDRSEAEVHALLRQLHWSMAWLYQLFGRRELADASEKCMRIGSVMEVLATALRRTPLQKTLFELANHIGRQLQCSRVAVGLVDEGAVRVAALSNAAWFEKNAGIMKLYRAAMEDVCDRSAMMAYVRNADGTAQADSIHARLARESGAQAILSLPLQSGAACLAVLTLERNEARAFDANEVAWLETLASMLPAVIEQKRRAERSYLAHLRDDLHSLLMRFFGPRNLIWKFAGACTLFVLGSLLLVDIDYRVVAKTVIEGEVQRTAVAPFDSFVAASYARAGDTVRKGQVLCLLDERDLLLEQQKWDSEREQHSRKLREAMARHELAQVQVLSAQVQQAEAQLALVGDRLARVKVTAPFDGVVISGDLSQLIGSPVEQGKKLFEIAPLQAYRVILQVDEREIRHLKTGQSGKLVIAGLAGEPLPLLVSKLTPVATAQDGHNFFRVEARLEPLPTQVPAQLRPGMEGIAKVSVGQYRLWWVLSHSFTDWLRLSLWTWLP